MTIFYQPRPTSVKIFLIFAFIECLQSLIESYLTFDQSVAHLKTMVSSYIDLSEGMYPILYALYIGINTLFIATQLYFIVLLKNNLMRLVYLLNNMLLFIGFFAHPDRVMTEFNSTNSQEYLIGCLTLISLICTCVTSVCLTQKHLVRWIKHREVEIDRI